MAGGRPAGFRRHERRRAGHGVFPRDAHRRRVGRPARPHPRRVFDRRIRSVCRRTSFGRRAAGIHRTAPRDVLRRAGGPGRDTLAAAARRLGPGLRHRGGPGMHRTRRETRHSGTGRLHVRRKRAFPARDAEARHDVRRRVRPPRPVRGRGLLLSGCGIISTRIPPCREYRPTRRPHRP